jgi:acyl-CoA thioesterase FadM
MHRPLESDILNLRVWPNDIDFNLHLNNARYLSVMDYGRIHMLARAGLLSRRSRRAGCRSLALSGSPIVAPCRSGRAIS